MTHPGTQRLRFRLTGPIQKIKSSKDSEGRALETFTVRLDHHALDVLRHEVPFHLGLSGVQVRDITLALTDMPLMKVTIGGRTGKKKGDQFSYLVMVDVRYELKHGGLARINRVEVVGPGF